VSCSAVDPQAPADPLTFSLISAPSNMTINASSGAILWTPAPAQAPSTNIITVQVADSDNPNLSATASFTVLVSAPATNSITTLTGILCDRCDNTGTTFHIDYWNTTPFDGIEDIFMIAGTNGNGPFINGPGDANVGPISINLSQPGTYTYVCWIDPRFLTNADLNLFFNGDNTHPRISVKCTTDTTNAFSANTSINTLALDGTATPAAGVLSFSDGFNQISLTDFRWYNSGHSDANLPVGDRVQGYSANPDSVNDARFLFTLTVAPLPQNLVSNWNFELGNVGFTSDYTLWDFHTRDLGAGYYWVGMNAFQVHEGYDPSFGDHTSGSGNMMIVNGGLLPTNAVWRETIPVTTNATYSFSVWATECNTNGVDAAKFKLYVNGVSISPQFQLTFPTGVWSNYAAVWNSGTSTSATLEFRLVTTQASGNDFALDDFSFMEVNAISTPPRLTLIRTGPSSVSVRWPSPSIGWTLQQNSILTGTNWTNSAYSISDDGTNKSVTINLPSGALFFRLKQ
jgi:hypothetical protein